MEFRLSGLHTDHSAHSSGQRSNHNSQRVPWGIMAIFWYEFHLLQIGSACRMKGNISSARNMIYTSDVYIKVI